MPRCLPALVSSLLLFLAPAACGGPSLDDTDLALLEEHLAASQAAPEDMTAQFVMQGLAAAPMGRSRSCLKLADATNKAAPVQWQTMAAKTLEACGLPCPSTEAFRSIARLPPEERSQALLTACDAEGPDPLFGGALADQRADFPMMPYLVTRMHADHLAAAVDKAGTDRAKAVWAGYQALAPRIAAHWVGLQKEEAAADGG